MDEQSEDSPKQKDKKSSLNKKSPTKQQQKPFPPGQSISNQSEEQKFQTNGDLSQSKHYLHEQQRSNISHLQNVEEGGPVLVYTQEMEQRIAVKLTKDSMAYINNDQQIARDKVIERQKSDISLFPQNNSMQSASVYHRKSIGILFFVLITICLWVMDILAICQFKSLEQNTYFGIIIMFWIIGYLSNIIFTMKYFYNFQPFSSSVIFVTLLGMKEINYLCLDIDQRNTHFGRIIYFNLYILFVKIHPISTTLTYYIFKYQKLNNGLFITTLIGCIISMMLIMFFIVNFHLSRKFEKQIQKTISIEPINKFDSQQFKPQNSSLIQNLNYFAYQLLYLTISLVLITPLISFMGFLGICSKINKKSLFDGSKAREISQDFMIFVKPFSHIQFNFFLFYQIFPIIKFLIFFLLYGLVHALVYFYKGRNIPFLNFGYILIIMIISPLSIYSLVLVNNGHLDIDQIYRSNSFQYQFFGFAYIACTIYVIVLILLLMSSILYLICGNFKNNIEGKNLEEPKLSLRSIRSSVDFMPNLVNQQAANEAHINIII